MLDPQRQRCLRIGEETAPYADVAMDEALTAVKLRREKEQAFAPAASKIAAQ